MVSLLGFQGSFAVPWDLHEFCLSEKNHASEKPCLSEIHIGVVGQFWAGLRARNDGRRWMVEGSGQWKRNVGVAGWRWSSASGGMIVYESQALRISVRVSKLVLVSLWGKSVEMQTTVVHNLPLKPDGNGKSLDYVILPLMSGGTGTHYGNVHQLLMSGVRWRHSEEESLLLRICERERHLESMLQLLMIDERGRQLGEISLRQRICEKVRHHHYMPQLLMIAWKVTTSEDISLLKTGVKERLPGSMPLLLKIGEKVILGGGQR